VKQMLDVKETLMTVKTLGQIKGVERLNCLSKMPAPF